MKKQIIIGFVALGLITGGVLSRSWAINWPQTGFREWQTAFNPVETLLEGLPDLFWWSQDVNLSTLAFRRGRAWAPVVMDVGVLGLTDPVVIVGRQSQLLFYRPDLPRGITAGENLPEDATVTFGGTNGGLTETGIITTNPVIAESPAVPAVDQAGLPAPRMVFVTHGLGVQNEPLTSDDPAYVQAVSITATDASFTVTTHGKLKIQRLLPSNQTQETRITGMTFADIGDSTTPLPLLFLTTADGQVICVDTREFRDTAANSTIDPKEAIRWRWTQPGPRINVPAGGGQPTPPSSALALAAIPFNDGMSPAVGRVQLNGLPDLPSLSGDVARRNQEWQDQVRLRNREWLVFVADQQSNAWAIEAFGETREEATNPGQSNQTLTGKATTRWTAKIPNGTAFFPARFTPAPLFWHGNTPTTATTGDVDTGGTGADDLVVFPGYNTTQGGAVVAFDAQGNFLTQDRPVFWVANNVPAGVPPTPSQVTAVTRRMGEADGTTTQRWRFPETGATPPSDGRFPLTLVRGMAAWHGERQIDNNGADFANTAADDDRIFLRWNEEYVRPPTRATVQPSEPAEGEAYVERLGAVAPYGWVETQDPIDAERAITVTFRRTVGTETRTFTIPTEYLAIRDDFEDITRTDATQRSHRGRITIVKPLGVDDQGAIQALAPGDQVTIRYTSSRTDGQRTEQDVRYPSRRGRDVEPVVQGVPTPQSGEVVPISVGRNAVTVQEEGTAQEDLDERILRSATEGDYNPPTASIVAYALNPGMSVANDQIMFGSRYRGRVYVFEAVSLLLRGQLTNTELENPTGGGGRPAATDDIRAAIDPIGNPAIAEGWMYVSYGNGFLAAFANFGGGGLGTDVEPPTGPFNREGSRRSAIPMPEIRVTDTTGNPVTDEDRLRFDWGQPIKLRVTFQNFEVDSLSLATNPVRVTIRGPMGDLPPVTVSPSRGTTSGSTAGVAEIEVIIPNATPANPMTPGTPLLREVTEISRRPGTAHWELRAEQIGTNWIRTDDSIGPWEPDRDAASWRPESNTAPWFTLNNPIALIYEPFRDEQPNGPRQDIALLPRFATAPATRFPESKNGDPYAVNQQAALGPDAKTPTVITVGVDPNSGFQLSDAITEHGKASKAIELGIVDRSDLGLRPSLGPLRVRVQLPKVTKLGFPLLDPSKQPTGIAFGSVDQNYPDDGPDGYYPSIPGNRLNVVKKADAANAAAGMVQLRGVSNGSNDPTDQTTTVGTDGYEVKVIQPEWFNVSVDVPIHQPDGVYSTRARLADPTTASGGLAPVPSPATAVNPRTPHRDFAPDDPNTDVNLPPVTFGVNDRPQRVQVFVDANNNGKLDLQGNYREAYRTFAVQVVVRPDMRLEAAAVAPRTGAASRLVDLGKLWHGFQTPTWQQVRTLDERGRTFFEQYWKPFVLMNTGNTNLVSVKPDVMLSLEGRPFGPVRLPSENVDLFESLTLMRDPSRPNSPPVNQILSDLNQVHLRTSFDDRLGLGSSNYLTEGAWLQKSRPGSSSPGTALYPGNPAAAANVPLLDPKLTLNVPMGTPLGTYAGAVRFFNDRQVAIIQDNSSPIGVSYQIVSPYGENNRVLDRQRDPNAGGQIAAVEPFAEPPLTVKVRVTENIAAGSTGDPNVLSQLGVQNGKLSRTSPAAGLDLTGNRMLLFFSSNQQGLTNGNANPLRFDIFARALAFNSSLEAFPFDQLPLEGNVWTNLGQVSDAAQPANRLVKNTKPFFAQDQRAGVSANGRAGYVFWHEEQSGGPGQSQSRIQYRRVTPQVGEIQTLAPGGSQFQEGNVRQSPRAVPVPVNGDLRWFVFWTGSQLQKNNVLFSQSANPDDPKTWTAETVVPTSPSLATVADPTPSYVPSTDTLWLFYNGFSQKLGRSDVYATKLDPRTLGSRQLVEDPETGRTTRSPYGVLRMAPRLGEILRANPTRTTFTGSGVDWRVDNDNPLAIFINGYLPLGSRPALTPVNGLEVYLNGQPVSDIQYRGPGANDEQTWSFRAPMRNGATATVYLAVDPAAGSIRFSQAPGRLQVTGLSADRQQFPDPQVTADYLPRSLRLTSSDIGASGGAGFATSTYEPSWYHNTAESRRTNQPVNQQALIGARADRLWAVWRRSGSATTQGPTLYYKALRPGLQIITPLRGPAGTFYSFNVQAADGQPAPVLQDVDIQDGVLYFLQEAEGRRVTVSVSGGGQSFSETHYIAWREEGSEAPVPMDIAVNEGNVTAFPMLDQQPFVPIGGGGAPSLQPHLSGLWLFWTSSRGTGSDIFHATVNPRLTPFPGQ